ncbi:hypothetical protein [Clostridium baratii]|uniref:hypothetical protein n=1 Tax=Clostridium baratii TaxID=1561 RepID=UPI00242F4210|nr:hypothetical protein [Clostridium baratii]
MGDPIFFRFTKLIKFEDLTDDALKILVNNICNNKYSKLNDKDKLYIDIEYIKNTLISNIYKLDNVRQISNIIDEYIDGLLVKKFINEEKTTK